MNDLPGPISLGAIKKGVISDPDHQKKQITEYIEWQLNKGSEKEQHVTHLEKVKSEVVFGEEHTAWDVHTDYPARWWVITNPTNLYSQTEFPTLDYTLSFHVGVTARVASREAKKAPDERKERLRSTWRRWEDAAEALDGAKEPEAFQAIGMMCRETLLDMVKTLQDEIPEPDKDKKPKSADFIGWSELAVIHYASGQRNKHIRSYLRASAKETWHLVNWLTHTSNASLYEAHLGLDAAANILSLFSLVVVKGEGNSPELCPKCKSYRMVSVYEPDLELEHPYVGYCESCGWNTYDEKA